MTSVYSISGTSITFASITVIKKDSPTLSLAGVLLMPKNGAMKIKDAILTNINKKN